VAAHAGRLDVFSTIDAPVLILRGSRGPAAATFDALRDVLPDARLEVMKGLGHFGPEGRTAATVAERVRTFLADA
jgi:hypothetical protein